jgi:hypothetical protein
MRREAAAATLPGVGIHPFYRHFSEKASQRPILDAWQNRQPKNIEICGVVHRLRERTAL